MEPSSRSRRSSLSSTTSQSHGSISHSGEKRLNAFRFVVEKEKRMGRSTTKILQVVPNTRSVLVMEGRSSRLTHEIPISGFKLLSSNKVKAEYRGRQRVYVFASTEDRRRFGKCLEDVLDQTDELIKIDAPTSPVERIEFESFIGSYEPVTGRRRGSSRHYRGRLIATTYRILFCPGFAQPGGEMVSTAIDAESIPDAIPALEVPGLGILDLQKEGDQDEIVIHCKDLRVLEFRLNNLAPQKRKQLFESIRRLAFPPTIEECFPFGGRVKSPQLLTQQSPALPAKTLARPKRLDKKKRLVMPERAMTSHEKSPQRRGTDPKHLNSTKLKTRHLSITQQRDYNALPQEYNQKLFAIEKDIEAAKNTQNFERCLELDREKKRIQKLYAANAASQTLISPQSTPSSPVFGIRHSASHNRVRSFSEEKFPGETPFLDSFEKHNLQQTLKEYTRLGLIGRESRFQITTLNHQYKLCSSYPEIIIVPKDVPDKVLKGSAEFRSGGRLPAVVWMNSQGLTIARSSQPRSGLSGHRNASDEALIGFLRDTRPRTQADSEHSTDPFLILDARPKINAIGNRAKGKGYENSVAYEKCTILFMGIENIHVMRESVQAIQVLCEDLNDDKWLTKLEASKWLFHIKTVLFAAKRVVQGIEKDGMSVLVHCSDGWDRTAQICGLAEILLDPHYRTIEGFQILIQKEWLWFGHKFADRVSNYGVHGVRQTANSKKERSPVFLQFLDCVHQIMVQYPTSFEFDETLLFCVAEHFNSGRFGTFLCNNEREREKLGVYEYANSLWEFIDGNAADGMYQNPLYISQEEGVASVLWPSCTILNMSFWTSYYCRWTDDDRDNQLTNQAQMSLRMNGVATWSDEAIENLKTSLSRITSSDAMDDYGDTTSRRTSRQTLLDDEDSESLSIDSDNDASISNSSYAKTTNSECEHADNEEGDSSPSTGLPNLPKPIRAQSAGEIVSPPLSITITQARKSVNAPPPPHRFSQTSAGNSPKHTPGPPELMHSQSDTSQVYMNNFEGEPFSTATSKSRPFRDKGWGPLRFERFKKPKKRSGSRFRANTTEIAELRDDNERLKTQLEYYQTFMAHKEVICSSCGQLVYSVNGTANAES